MPAPETVVVNADIRTMDGHIPRCAALAIGGGRIVALGSDAEIRALAGPGTAVIDAGGRLVLPGFHDTHLHVIEGGQHFAASVDLSEPLSASSPVSSPRHAGKEPIAFPATRNRPEAIFSGNPAHGRAVCSTRSRRPMEFAFRETHFACRASRRVDDRGLFLERSPALDGRRRPRAGVACPEPKPRSDRQHRPGARLGRERAPQHRRRSGRHAVRHPSRSSALAAGHAERRRPRRGEQRPGEATARPARVCDEPGHARRRSQGAECRPDLAHARRRRRRRRRDAHRPRRRADLALRNGAARRQPLCRRHRRRAALPVHSRRDPDHRARCPARELAGRGHQPPLDQGSCRRAGRCALRLCRLEQRPRRERSRSRGRPRRHLADQSGHRSNRRLRQRTAQSGRSGIRAGNAHTLDRGERARRARRRSRARLPDLSPPRRLLRLAVELLGRPRRPEGRSAAPGSRRAGSRLRPRRPRRAARARLRQGRPARAAVCPRRLHRPARLLEPQAARGLPGHLRAVRRRQARRRAGRGSERVRHPGRHRERPARRRRRGLARWPSRRR